MTTIIRLLLVASVHSATSAHAGPPTAAPVVSSPPEARWPDRTRHQVIEIGGHRMFYREAGPAHGPAVLLLHGYPSSSHTYRHLIPLLSGHVRVIAPDNLGSGYSDHPTDRPMTFDRLGEQMIAFVDALGLDDVVIYMQDFGAPVGFRLAMARSDRVRGLVVQNGNAYLDGLTPKRQAFFRDAAKARTDEELKALRHWVSDEAIRTTQYLRDVPGERAVYMSPDTWTHDIATMPAAAHREIQVDLFRDYQSNIDAYPRWQAWMRAHPVPALVLWGERDPAFIADGARAYLRDLPHAELHLLDAGHFAAEERPVEVAQHLLSWLAREVVPSP